LNTGSFYIKIDKKEEFEPIIQEINESLRGEIEVKAFDERSDPKEIDIRPNLKKLKVPRVNRVVEEELLQELKSLISEEMRDYREDEKNTTFVGSRQTIIKKMSQFDSNKIKIKEFAKTNKVTARVIFVSHIKSYFPKLLGIIDIENAKFNALIGYGSSAYKDIIYIAKKAIKIYTDQIVLEQDETEPESIKKIIVYPDKNPQSFVRSLHEEYSGLNELESSFASELDKINNL
jgi:type III restriction enzyme